VIGALIKPYFVHLELEMSPMAIPDCQLSFPFDQGFSKNLDSLLRN
jgi:hypothetical protein